MTNVPPKLARKILLWFLREELAEEVLGDLDEKFYSLVSEKSGFTAKVNYWYQVLNYIRPFAIRNLRSGNSNQHAMFHSYVKIGWRNLLKNKGHSLINIGGLALGMTVAILNGLWIWDELSFNQYHENYDRIGQIVKGQTHKGEYGVGSTMTYPLGTELKTNYEHDFKYIVRTTFEGDYILAVDEKKISVKGMYADPDLPSMLTLKMLYGDRAGLRDAHSIMLSATIARSIFGASDPTNKIVTLNNQTELKVTGVYEDLPGNTSFTNVQFFTTWQLYLLTSPWIEARALNDWRNHFTKIYVQIPPGSNFDEVSARIKDSELKNLSAFKEEQAKNPRIFIHPMKRWHLYSYDRGQINREPLQMIWLVGIIGWFVLMLACINFMNLSTARSEKRAKEVGIRKTIGSVRSQLMHQFFSESYLVVLFAFGLALLLAGGALPWFNLLTAKNMTLPLWNHWFWIFSLTFIFITGLLAGSYPAFFLSSFNPVQVLKGSYRAGPWASIPRKVLVVFQFSISVVLIISTIVVYQQIRLGKDRPTGYDPAGLIMLQMKSEDFYGKYDVLRSELKRTGAVVEMSQSMGPVTNVYSGNSGFKWNGKSLSEESFGTLPVTHEHGKTVGWQFVAGRDFSREYASDSSGMVINETAAKYFGGHNPVGEQVTWDWWENNRPTLQYTIIGVIKDMVMESPYQSVEPTVFYIKGHNGSVSCMNIKLKPGIETRVALSKIETVFKKLIPSAPFDYQFVDEEYARKFAAEERIGKLASLFGLLAILISCLGLFGLASFVAEQRTKEIGIRKVLGASLTNLWGMLSKEFVGLVIISCFIAVPIARYCLNLWLEKYAYRIEVSWLVLVMTSIGALLITLLTVSFQAINAALMNPVHSLRSE